MNVERFILFGHPRSGSTTLARLLNAHPDLTVLVEPFSETFHRWSAGNPNYLERICDAESLDRQLEQIFAVYDGIKTINWPLSFELYAHMLSSTKRRIIFLRRRNMLKAAVSCAVCHRIGAWQKQDLKDDWKARYKAIGVIPVEEIIDWIEAVKEDMDRYEAILNGRSRPTVHKIVYEDLFDGDSAQQETVFGIFDFLGVRHAWSPEMENLLDSKANRMNTPETYRLIRNHREIDEVGSQRGHGTLFSA